MMCTDGNVLVINYAMVTSKNQNRLLFIVKSGRKDMFLELSLDKSTWCIVYDHLVDSRQLYLYM